MMGGMRASLGSSASGRGRHNARSVLGLFAAGTAAAVLVAIVGGYFTLRSVAVKEAEHNTRARVLELAKLVEASLEDGILATDAGSIAAVDEVVLTGILSGSVFRVKLWSQDGRVLYSDDPRQIGGRYALGAEQLELLREGGAEVETTSLDRPENALDRTDGDVIEAYTRIRTPSGEPVLFELYERFESISSSARRLLGALAPPILGAVGLILLVQVPLVWSLSRRLQRGYEEREGLLSAAVAASNRERRRIASYLHDGPVQEIAGVAFGLAPVADAATARGAAEEAAELRRHVDQLRQNVRDLRTLLVDLHPPNLAAQGLESALADLVSPLEARGLSVSVVVDEADRLDPEQRALVFRAAQEAVRNVVAYSGASRVTVSLRPAGDRLRLEVTDDGRGFGRSTRAARANEGHLGLSLLEELALMSGAELDVRSSPGKGTTVALEVPLR